MAKIIRSLCTFYHNFFLVGFILSFCCGYAYQFYGCNYKTLPFLFWFKVITMAIIWYAVTTNKRKEFFYYQNLGISKTLLWMVTLGIDFILFVSMLILAFKMQ
ncbi:hypothetical protein [Pedobacter sp. Hv1]|uniref:hypothetical protein n=1 Tax=Pedobacter sp. Hv1 TaxID=1740090 RepID=UPI0006D88E55|nr:hypothetical protein [Pedobacter sp. Hv1]KQC00290.1 hypothetical protein AQF98_12420 [Pedobacter sp. Hv1]